MGHKKTFSELIEALGLTDYEIARQVGASRSAIRSLRVGQNSEPGYTLGLRLAHLSGIAIPGTLRKLQKDAQPDG